MTRAEAEAEAARLSREHPQRAAHRWLARERSADEWEVVRIALPAGTRIDPLTATIEANPRPSPADDPRPNTWRDLGGPHIGGGA